MCIRDRITTGRLDQLMRHGWPALLSTESAVATAMAAAAVRRSPRPARGAERDDFLSTGASRESGEESQHDLHQLHGVPRATRHPAGTSAAATAVTRATPEAGKAPADTSGTGALPAIASPRSDVPKATAAVPSPAPTGLLPPYRNADQDVRYGVRVAAGYAWRLIAITIAVYGIFIFLGRIQLVGIAVFVGLVISALLRPVA